MDVGEPNRSGLGTYDFVYGPYGGLDLAQVRTPSGWSNAYGTFSVGFAGEFGASTDSTGLVLMTHRYYDPLMERFVTRDPIGYQGGINLYAYAGNNPVNRMTRAGLPRSNLCTRENLTRYRHIILTS